MNVISRHAGHAVSFKAVRAGGHRIAGIVTGAVGDHAGLRASSSLILKTIFIKSEPMSAILVKMPPADTQRGRAQRFADGESDETVSRIVRRYKKQECIT